LPNIKASIRSVKKDEKREKQRDVEHDLRRDVKAAGELFITPQGLRRIIRKLEYEFQAVLFERTSTGTIPTEYGDYLYTHRRYNTTTWK